ncbi:MAG: hypothetical protein WA771_15680 [Chthoniobacterales bacterium]
MTDHTFFTRILTIFALLLVGLVTGCQTVDPEVAARQAAMRAAIQAETPGDYFVARRFYKNDYKVWGWVREPRQPWSTAKLVMLNEQRTLAPDRAANRIGYDNNFEYTLRGGFSGEKIYEPASNNFYPEFILNSYDLRSTAPPLIFKERRSTQPEVRLLTPPV